MKIAANGLVLALSSKLEEIVTTHRHKEVVLDSFLGEEEYKMYKFELLYGGDVQLTISNIKTEDNHKVWCHRWSTG